MKIAVIGGGVMGLSCAWRLAAAGARVELFDARGCGEGATLAALGALWPASPLHDGPLQRLHRTSLRQFELFVNELAAYTRVPVAYRRLGRLEFLNSSKAISRAADEAAAANERWPGSDMGQATMQVLNSTEVASLYPHLAAQGHSALLCRVTAQVQVQQLVDALRIACVQAGVLVHEHIAVTAFEQQGGHVSTVRTAATATAVDAVLVTAGAWSPRLSPELAAVMPVRPVKGQGLALRAPPNMRLGYIVKSGPIYLVPWENEILVGSTTEPDVGFDEMPSIAAREFLLQGAATICPALDGATLLRHWAGLRPQNPKAGHMPIMGPHPRIPNVHLCTGHYKTGIGLAPLISHLMATAILNNSLSAELLPFLPEAPLV